MLLMDWSIDTQPLVLTLDIESFIQTNLNKSYTYEAAEVMVQYEDQIYTK